MPVDHYIKSNTLGSQMRKFGDIADMTDDVTLRREVEETKDALARGGIERRTFQLRNQSYTQAEGIIKTVLEDPQTGYIIDPSMPSAIAVRALTYEQKVPQVSADATLAPKKKDDGSAETDDQGRVLTLLHGYVNPDQLTDARGALFLEAYANKGLYRTLQDPQYLPPLQKLFESGRPMFFTPRRKSSGSAVEAGFASVEELAEAETAEDVESGSF